MTRLTRLGAVDYLNVRPLVYGLDRHPAISLRFDLPARCAKLLDAGEIDVGMIPTIALFDRSDNRVVPGVGIISDGPVASVALFTRRPIGRVRTLALDTSSRTSVALTRILCARVFGISPAFAAHPPDLAAMLDACDAALLIGDSALFADAVAVGAEKIDLGSTWTVWTGRPFVWAFWAGAPGAAGAEIVRILQGARDAGVAASDRVADAYCEGDPARQAVARRYLRENMKYDLTPLALEGLERFYAEAAALQLIGQPKPLTFY